MCSRVDVRRRRWDRYDDDHFVDHDVNVHSVDDNNYVDHVIDDHDNDDHDDYDAVLDDIDEPAVDDDSGAALVDAG